MFQKILNRIDKALLQGRDWISVARIKVNRDSWPCLKNSYLVVGCESSGTTPISHLLFNNGSLRFLVEGWNNWVWEAAQLVYQEKKHISNYPRLQLFDAVKVPAFAAILSQYKSAFPNVSIIYVIRDPRDVLASTFRTWGKTRRDELLSVPWISSQWLGIDAEDPVDRLAIRWRYFLESSYRVPNVIYVRYEDFCANKIGVIKDLATKLDLDINERETSERCDRQASHESVRNYVPQGPGAWRSAIAESDAKLIERVCMEHMRRWNYL